MALWAAERSGAKSKGGWPLEGWLIGGSGSGPSESKKVESLFICFKPTAKKEIDASHFVSSLDAVGFEYHDIDGLTRTSADGTAPPGSP